MTEDSLIWNMQTPVSLAGRTVLVTGGSSGIGRSIADALQGAGASVAILGRRPPATWDVRPSGPPPGTRTWIAADFCDVDGLLTAVQAWLERIKGEIDAVVYSAVAYGSNSRRPLAAVTREEWDELFAVNVRAPFLLTQATLPALLRRPCGLIVGLTSEVVFNGGPGRIGYAASKAAAYSMLVSLAQELEGTEVRVVTLMPATMVDTPGIRRRRLADFDYSSYASPQSFVTPILDIFARMGVGLHGGCFVVRPDGAMASAHGNPCHRSRVAPDHALRSYRQHHSRPGWHRPMVP